MTIKLLSLDEVCNSLALAQTTISRLMSDGKFPSPLKDSSGQLGWRADQVEAWEAEQGPGLDFTGESEPHVKLNPDDPTPYFEWAEEQIRRVDEIRQEIDKLIAAQAAYA